MIAGLTEHSVASDLVPRAPTSLSPLLFFFLSSLSFPVSLLCTQCLSLPWGQLLPVSPAVTSGLVAPRHPALEMT